MAEFSFTTDGIEAPSDPANYEVIKEGMYKAMILSSEVRLTKAGTGEMIELTWEIQEGPYASRKIWDRLNIKNPNPKAEEIAQRDLAAICRSFGKVGITDTEELHDKLAMIKVVVRPPSNGYMESNEIKAYAPVGPQAAPAPATQASAVATSAPDAPAGKKPWE